MGTVLKRKFIMMYIEIQNELIHLFIIKTIDFDDNWNLNQTSFVHYYYTFTNDRIRNCSLIASTQT